MADPPGPTGRTEVKTATVHIGSRYSRNVMDPVGAKAPTRVAVSRTGVPTGPPGEGAARMADVRLVTTIVNVWQAGGERTPLVQTVVGPKAPAAVGTPVRNPCGVMVIPGGRLPLVTTKTGSRGPALN